MRSVETAVDWEKLVSWMTSEGLGTGKITNVVNLTGGTQNILLRFTRDNVDYVFRRPPLHPRPTSNETMRREARVLKALSGSKVPHPKLIASCSDESILGFTFYLMAPIEGFNPVSGLPQLHATSAEIQYRMGLAMVEALAAIGDIDYIAVGLEGFGKPNGYLERQVTRMREQISGYSSLANWPGPESLGNFEQVAQWLENNRPKEFTPGIMHGDYHLANVMFQNDSAELAAVVDWELASIGDPLIDLGWLLATWPIGDGNSAVEIKPWIGFPNHAQLVAHYRECASRGLENINWYAVFACFKLAILIEGTYARACAGKVSMEIGQKLHDRAKHLIARAENWILEGVPV